jgi:hypothetical protein
LQCFISQLITCVRYQYAVDVTAEYQKVITAIAGEHGMVVRITLALHEKFNGVQLAGTTRQYVQQACVLLFIDAPDEIGAHTALIKALVHGVKQ